MSEKRCDLLFIWELGAGLGHVSRMQPLVMRALSAGLSVKCLAVRAKAAAAFLPCKVEPAPWLKAPKHPKPPHIGHLADTLAALGWDRLNHLRQAIAGWRFVLEREQPKVVVLDSAPTALLASQGLGLKQVALANAWNTPPDKTPLPDMSEWVTGTGRLVPDTEPAVVSTINQLLRTHGEPTINNLADLFARVDATAMLTYEELDPHGPRPAITYRGVWGAAGGQPADWPTSRLSDAPPGIFAYLKPFPIRPAALRLLVASGLPTLLYATHPSSEERAILADSAVRLLQKPINWTADANRLAFVLCHGGLGTTSAALKKGVPVIAMPLSLEQAACTRCAIETAAGIEARHDDAESIRSAMHRVLTDESVAQAAQRFADKYADHDPDREAARVGDEIVALCSET